jgi:hypothetical protein
VIEDPLSQSNEPLARRTNLHGKPKVEGYDSHYVLVNSKGYPAALHEQPAADEIVLFEQSQILPRYLVYYRRCEAFRMLWIDNAHYRNSDIIMHLRTMLHERQVKLVLAQLATTAELRQWLATNRIKAQRQAAKNKLLIVTNCDRKHDGGALAASVVCEWVRQQQHWKSTPIVVMGRQASENAHLARTYRGVKVIAHVVNLVACVNLMLDRPNTLNTMV